MISTIKKWLAKRRQKRKERIRKFFAIPHLFAKCIIVHCIFTITVAAYWSLYAQSNGADMTGLFIAIATPFVSELAMLLLKKLFKEENGEKEEEEKETEELEENG